MNGDSWRWDPERHPYPSRISIYVIEPAEQPKPLAAGADRVAFGFSVRTAPAAEPEWLGNPS